MRYLIALVIIFNITVTSLYSSLTPVWSQSEVGGRTSMALVVNPNYVYVTGFTASDEYLTIKYNNNDNGNRVTTNRLDINGLTARGIASDLSGNIYITGEDTSGSEVNFLTFKYNPFLNEIWTNVYYSQATLISSGAGVVVDPLGDAIYVVGTDINSSSQVTQFVTIKYQTNGNGVWTNKIRCNPGSGNYSYQWQAGMGMDIDSSGYIYYTGQKDNQCFIAKINRNGFNIWTNNYSEGLFGTDIVVGDDYLYVVGASNNKFFTMKCDTDGNKEWVKYSTNGTRALGVAKDNLDNCYVTGYLFGTYNMIAMKYNSSGDVVWTYKASDDGDTQGRGNDIFVDSNRYVYITGRYDTQYITYKFTQSPEPTTPTSDTNTNANRVALTDQNDVRVENSFHNMNSDDSTTIMFKALQVEEVTITIYDLRGRKLYEKKQVAQLGDNYIDWDFKNDNGNLVSSGVYAIWVKGGGVDKYIKIAVYR